MKVTDFHPGEERCVPSSLVKSPCFTEKGVSVWQFPQHLKQQRGLFRAPSPLSQLLLSILSLLLHPPFKMSTYYVLGQLRDTNKNKTLFLTVGIDL